LLPGGEGLTLPPSLRGALDRLEYLLFGGTAALVGRLPRAWALAIGRALGLAGYLLAAGRRRIALANLEVAFGASKSATEQRRIARASFMHAGSALFDAMLLSRLTRERAARIVEVGAEDLALVREAYARGRGVIFLAAHFGYPEIAGAFHGYQGLPLTIVVRRMDNPYLDARFREYRTRSGNGVVVRGHASRRLLEILRGGGGVAILIDQNLRLRESILVDFFGLPVPATRTVGSLTLATGAAIIPVVSYPLARGRCRLTYGPEIRYAVTGDRWRDIAAITEACFRHIEGIVRRHPEYYLWVHRRWKNRFTPEDARWPFYAEPVRERYRGQAASVSLERTAD
jgi:KDO2-lipid IV(A) lauroyltransferase